MISEWAARAMDDMAEWGVKNIRRTPASGEASKADRIINEGALARREYREKHSTAEDSMVYGAQIGHLHGEVRRLCAEFDVFDNPETAPGKPPAREDWPYIDVRANGDLGSAMLRCFYDRSTDSIDLCAVFLRGVDLSIVLTPQALGCIETTMRYEVELRTEAENIEAAITRREA